MSEDEWQCLKTIKTQTSKNNQIEDEDPRTNEIILLTHNSYVRFSSQNVQQPHAKCFFLRDVKFPKILKPWEGEEREGGLSGKNMENLGKIEIYTTVIFISKPNLFCSFSSLK